MVDTFPLEELHNYTKSHGRHYENCRKTRWSPTYPLIRHWNIWLNQSKYQLTRTTSSRKTSRTHFSAVKICLQLVECAFTKWHHSRTSLEYLNGVCDCPDSAGDKRILGNGCAKLQCLPLGGSCRCGCGFLVCGYVWSYWEFYFQCRERVVKYISSHLLSPLPSSLSFWVWFAFIFFFYLNPHRKLSTEQLCFYLRQTEISYFISVKIFLVP